MWIQTKKTNVFYCTFKRKQKFIFPQMVFLNRHLQTLFYPSSFLELLMSHRGALWFLQNITLLFQLEVQLSIVFFLFCKNIIFRVQIIYNNHETDMDRKCNIKFLISPQSRGWYLWDGWQVLYYLETNYIDPWAFWNLTPEGRGCVWIFF